MKKTKFVIIAVVAASSCVGIMFRATMNQIRATSKSDMEVARHNLSVATNQASKSLQNTHAILSAGQIRSNLSDASALLTPFWELAGREKPSYYVDLRSSVNQLRNSVIAMEYRKSYDTAFFESTRDKATTIKDDLMRYSYREVGVNDEQYLQAVNSIDEVERIASEEVDYLSRKLPSESLVD